MFLFFHLLNHPFRQLLEQVGSFLVHRGKLSDLSSNYFCYIVYGKRVLLLFRQCIPHGLKHCGGGYFSRLSTAIHIFFNIPQDGKENILDFFNLRFMFPQLLGVQKLQILLCFRPVFRVFIHQVRQGSRCHLDNLEMWLSSFSLPSPCAHLLRPHTRLSPRI